MKKTMTSNPIAQVRMYEPYVGPFDPCPPIRIKMYDTPPQLFFMYQPVNMPQFSPFDALKLGTLSAGSIQSVSKQMLERSSANGK